LTLTPISIELPPDFDFGWALRFLAARTVPALEAIADGEYHRSVRVDGRPLALVMRVAADGDRTRRRGRRLLVSSRPNVSPAVLERAVRRMFDLDVDLARFRRLARSDSILASVVRQRAGIRLPQLLDPFEGLTRAILGQQVSVAGASTLTDRLVRLFSRPVPGARGMRFFAFPAPADVAEAGAERLRELGLTRTRAATLAGVASAIAGGALNLEQLRGVPAADAQAALEALPGIGPWTASYVRMRALGDRDAFPGADLGVIKALAAAGVPRAEIATVAERWRPWRGYATLYLWESLSR
jgi:3-methyladenine DNA glycosylase/8-oxoguanine DNA glycosylase